MPAPASRAGSASCWPVRLLVAADFGARRARGEIHRADRVAIDDLIPSLEPRIPSGAGLPNEVVLRSLADFTPQSLRRSLAASAAEDASAEVVEAALHAPSFQAIEAAWRGLARLLEEVTGPGPGAGSGAASHPDGIEVDLIDRTPAGLRRSPGSLFSAALRDGRRRYTAILVDSDLGGTTADGACLEAIAGMAERCRTAVVLSVAPSLLGLQHAAHLPGIVDPAARLDSAWNGAWRAFRASDAARWISLTVNRVLLRAPYTRESHGHEERVSPARPGDYLWGRGIWLAGADLLRSATRHGHPLALSGIVPERHHLNLPRWEWTGPGGARLASSVEAAFDQEAAQRLIRAGLGPIIEPAGAGTAALPLHVNAYRPDPRRIPVEGTLAHTLVLAHFVSTLAQVAPLAASERDDEAAGALLRRALLEGLAPRLGRETSVGLETSIQRTSGQRLAAACLRGNLTDSGRDEEIELSIPLVDEVA